MVRLYHSSDARIELKLSSLHNNLDNVMVTTADRSAAVQLCRVASAPALRTYVSAAHQNPDCRPATSSVPRNLFKTPVAEAIAQKIASNVSLSN
eukprot:scaffold4423_cov66-Skeletonema_marinoi.AAC.2